MEKLSTADISIDVYRWYVFLCVGVCVCVCVCMLLCWSTENWKKRQFILSDMLRNKYLMLFALSLNISYRLESTWSVYVTVVEFGTWTYPYKI